MNNNDISPEDCFEEQDSQACDMLVTRAWHTVGTRKVFRRQKLKVRAELQDIGKGRQNSPQYSCIIIWVFPTTSLPAICACHRLHGFSSSAGPQPQESPSPEPADALTIREVGRCL